MTLNQTAKTDQPDTAEGRKIPVVYRATEGDPPTTVWRNRTFVVDKPVELDPDDEGDAAIIEAARGNPSFDVDGEDKAKQRQEAVHHKVVEAAEVELKNIQTEGEAMEQRHDTEMAALEKQHQQERDAFQNAKEQRAIELRRIIRGSDGSDDLQPVEEEQPPNPNQPDQSPPAEQAQADHKEKQPSGAPPKAPDLGTGGAGGPVDPAKPQEKPTDPSAPAPAHEPADPVRQDETLAAEQDKS